MRRLGRERLRADRRGAVALMVGVMSPMLMGFLALTVDAGFWVVGQTRLQVAADAGAMGASFLLSSSTFKGMTAANQQTAAQAVALAEAQGAMTKLTGTLTTPVTVSVAGDYSAVTVTLYGQASNYFGKVFNIAAPLMRATATATLPKSSKACVLALGTTGNAILVDNQGTLSATGCVVSKASIYLNSGTITADSLVAAGTISQSNSGSNTLSANSQTANASSTPADPYASKTAPSAGSCTTHPDYTAYGTYTANPGTWCGNQVIGGNSSTITFNPGVYVINNGDLTFNNASITSAAGVTFVLTGTSPGNFSWTNYSNTTFAISAPTSGSTAGIAVWQGCNSGGSQTTSFQGGSTLNLSGSVYAPCSATDIGNYAQIAPPLNGTMNFISKSVYVHGSAALRASGTAVGGGGGGTVAVLTQ